ncbi:MAG: PQQ-binding-like beta-propeller repeat protein [Fibrobacter sp.]|nr:PQQ-binding-like beta-propeller repeat protein [Fibrobacter sp.]
MIKLNFLLIFLLVTSTTATNLPETCREETWVPNGIVNTIHPAGDIVYIGGSFNSVGPYTGSCAVIDQNSGNLIDGFPKFGGRINAVCSDSDGGICLAGDFFYGKNSRKEQITYFSSQKKNEPVWSVKVDSSYNIYTMLLHDSTLYVGGRSYVKAYDIKTGKALDWRLPVKGDVTCITQYKSMLYFAGQFDSVDNVRCHSLAAYDTEKKSVKSWSSDVENVSISGTISSIVATDKAIFICGNLTVDYSGQLRKYLAAFDAETGKLTNWDPMPNKRVYSLSANGNTLCVGGSFDTIGGQYHKSVVAFNCSTGVATSWKPEIDDSIDSVLSVLLMDTNIVTFGTTKGNRQVGILSSTHVTSGHKIWSKDMTFWEARYPTFTASKNAFVINNAGVFGKTKNCIAAIDTKTGQAKEWTPAIPWKINAFVTAITVHDSTVYIGGDRTVFDTTGNRTNNSLAALHAKTGEIIPWNNGIIFNRVTSMTCNNKMLFVGGFTIDSNANMHYSLAAYDLSNNRSLVWRLETGGILSMIIDGATLYVGGTFDFVGEQTRNNLAALDAATGKLIDWKPAINRSVYQIAKNEQTLYVCGNFDTINGNQRRNLASFDMTTGNLTTWNPSPNYEVQGIAIDKSTLYLSGRFDSIGGQCRNRLAAIDVNTSYVLQWNPVKTSVINGYRVLFSMMRSSLAASGGALYSGIQSDLLIPYDLQTARCSFLQYGEYQPDTPGSILKNPVPIYLHDTRPSSNFSVFGQTMKVSFNLPEMEYVSLYLYNLKGQVLRKVVNSYVNAGYYTVYLQNNSFTSGTYFLVFRTNGFKQEHRFSVVK